MGPSPVDEIAAGDRFAFGRNWSRFLASVDENRIRLAEQSLRDMLGEAALSGRRFLDVGCGSGLLSLAARRLGARVRSFDNDPQSVACARALRLRYRPDDPEWTVEAGSVLDEGYLATLGDFDVVYAWGVLHHTGQMTRAFGNVQARVAAGGRLFLAVYNDQGWKSRYWTAVKRCWNKRPAARVLLLAAHAPFLLGARWLVRIVTGRRELPRGMSLWHDMMDWLGGYPFEVAAPESVTRYFQDRGLALETLKTCGRRMGCNEFVFRRPG
jgi:2-polyprenyl-6-hydroxyphenyl methylase/3-demethylubiquinone-9 3-methyltransferase